MKNLALPTLPVIAVCALTGCSPPLAVAGLALDLIAPGAGGGSAFNNPYDRPPGEALQDSLSRIQDDPDPRCLDLLEDRNRAAQAAEAEDAAGNPRVTPASDTRTAPPKRAGVQLVCLPGTQQPMALFLHPTGSVAAQSPATSGSPDTGH